MNEIEKKALQEAKSENGDSTLEASRALAEKLNAQVSKKETPKTEKSERKKEKKSEKSMKVQRKQAEQPKQHAEKSAPEKPEKTEKPMKVEKPVIEQNKYEMRSYMRLPNESETIVRHRTNLTLAQTVEADLSYMKRKFSEAEQTMFTARELREASMTAGPAATDIHRSAMRKLAAVKKVKILFNEDAKSRTRYKYELLEKTSPSSPSV